MLHDVVIDEISLVEDYREQFRSFLREQSLEALVTRLEERAAANLEPEGDGVGEGK